MDGEERLYFQSVLSILVKVSYLGMHESYIRLVISKDGNIDFDGYNGTWILRIYRIYRRIFLHEYQYIGN